MNNPARSKVVRPSAKTGSRANPSKIQPGDENPPLDATDVRQGRSGRRVLTILIVGTVLAIGAMTAIAVFNETILTADVTPLPGPSDVQEQQITQ